MFPVVERNKEISLYRAPVVVTTVTTDFSTPSDRQMSLSNQRPRTTMPPQTVNETRGRVVFENDSEALRDCAGRTVSSNSRSVVCFACLSGQSSQLAEPLWTDPALPKERN